MPEDIDYNKLPEHIRDGAQRYVEDGIKPGDFLQAVFCNNLMESFARADVTNEIRMFHIVDFIYNEAPAACWGSEEIMKEWIRKGGLNAKSNKSDAGASEQVPEQETG